MPRYPPPSSLCRPELVVGAEVGGQRQRVLVRPNNLRRLAFARLGPPAPHACEGFGHSLCTNCDPDVAPDSPRCDCTGAIARGGGLPLCLGQVHSCVCEARHKHCKARHTNTARPPQQILSLMPVVGKSRTWYASHGRVRAWGDPEAMEMCSGGLPPSSIYACGGGPDVFQPPGEVPRYTLSGQN